MSLWRWVVGVPLGLLCVVAALLAFAAGHLAVWSLEKFISLGE